MTATLFDEPVIVADPKNAKEFRSLPPTHGQFVLLGALVSALHFGGVFAVVREIEAETKRTGARYWSFEQYDRFFAAAATDEAKWEVLLVAIVAKYARYKAARAAGLSAWHFAQSEERLRQAEDEAEARREAENAAAIAKSKADAYAKKVAEYEIDARARREARENVDRERPRNSGRVASNRKPAYVEPEPREYIAPALVATAIATEAEVDPPADVVEGEYESGYPVSELF